MYLLITLKYLIWVNSIDFDNAFQTPKGYISSAKFEYEWKCSFIV